MVLERFVNSFVYVPVVDFVGQHPRRRLRQFVELASQILTLLMGALGCSGEGSEFGINLEQ